MLSQNGEDNNTAKNKSRPQTTAQKGKKDELLQFEKDDNISNKTFEQFKNLKYKHTPPMGSPTKMSIKGK